MDSHTLKVLEYEKVRALLMQHASSELGKERVRMMAPLTDIKEVQQRLDETTEARTVIEDLGGLPLGGIRDVREAVDRAARDGMLQPRELLDVADTLHAARRLKLFLARYRSRYPLLHAIAADIADLNTLEKEIRRAINDRAEVVDEASPELAQIRSNLRILSARLQERLEHLIHSSVYERMLQEPVIVRRSGRLCVPVKAEFRHAFDGLVHDTSASGATVFMEPAAVLEMQNDLRELEANETHEIERILTNLSHQVRRYAAEMMMTLRALGLLDFIHAKALLSRAQNAVPPKLNNQGHVYLRQARHPLLSGNVVPIDIRLGRDFQTLVITGPNTGGKTVTLKTLGLLTLMAQSGLHIPAEEGSEVAVFRQVFADIGDEQSIEQSLSTFSSHIGNIVRILRHLKRPALVLLDEIGAGTDPVEGSALARALLEYLTARGALTVATTHYTELKEYAYVHPGMENASVEFDVETLQPTYRLLIGVPGSSNALTIAQRLGIPDEVIERAKASLRPEHLEVEGLIRRIEEDVRAARNEREAAAAMADDVERVRKQLTQELEKTRRQRDQTLAEAAAQAAEIVRKTQEEARQILAQLRAQTRENRETNAAMQALKRLAEQVREQQPTLTPTPALLPEPANDELPYLARAPRPGDDVVAQPFGGHGTVVSVDEERQEALVQVGAVRLTLPFSELRVTRPQPQPVRHSAPRMTTLLTKVATFSPELHLRGLMAEEAVRELDKYLDDAFLAGVPSVRIIHGKGTGALRNAVWQFLRDHPHVESYRLADQHEGGTGATVVELKKG